MAVKVRIIGLNKLRTIQLRLKKARSYLQRPFGRKIRDKLKDILITNVWRVPGFHTYPKKVQQVRDLEGEILNNANWSGLGKELTWTTNLPHASILQSGRPAMVKLLNSKATIDKNSITLRGRGRSTFFRFRGRNGETVRAKYIKAVPPYRVYSRSAQMFGKAISELVRKELRGILTTRTTT